MNATDLTTIAGFVDMMDYDKLGSQVTLQSTSLDGLGLPMGLFFASTPAEHQEIKEMPSPTFKLPHTHAILDSREHVSISLTTPLKRNDSHNRIGNVVLLMVLINLVLLLKRKI